MQGLHLELPVTDISSIMLSDEGDILSDNRVQISITIDLFDRAKAG